MARIAAIQCDWDGCNILSTEARAKDDGWLLVGGGRRGRHRTDLCDFHSRMVIKRFIQDFKDFDKSKSKPRQKKG